MVLFKKNDHESITISENKQKLFQQNDFNQSTTQHSNYYNAMTIFIQIIYIKICLGQHAFCILILLDLQNNTQCQK